jgi:peptidoglycan/xylan/chitin deacetylase (PgdA/CDA1 family)
MKLPRRREVLAAVLYRLGVAHAVGGFRRLFGLGPAIYLMGHRVLPAGAAAGDPVDRMALLSGHAITPHALERRLRFVQRWVMPAGDPAELRHGLSRRRAFYLTFDDGYRDNAEVAAPVLDRLGIRAVIFFVADLLARPTATPWWDRWGADELAKQPADAGTAVASYGARCKQFKQRFAGLRDTDLRDGPRRYLTRDELAALPDTFYAGNHTCSHANLTLLNEAELARHIDDGSAALRAHPRYLPLLAFPFGFFNDAVLKRLREAPTHALAFATGNGQDGNALCQRRVNLNVQPFSLFALQCAGVLR